MASQYDIFNHVGDTYYVNRSAHDGLFDRAASLVLLVFEPTEIETK